MNKQVKFLSGCQFLVFAICLVLPFTVSANSEKNQLLITQNLAKKLKNDLGSSVARVKLNSVEEYKVSADEVVFEGNAACILADGSDELPIRFEAKVNSLKNSVSKISYNFVESSASFAPTFNEETLMKELMSKIKKDYRTENIVIAFDTVENIENITGERKFLGFGEVRIGDFVWSKIKFDVVLDAQTQKANKIVYQINK